MPKYNYNGRWKFGEIAICLPGALAMVLSFFLGCALNTRPPDETQNRRVQSEDLGIVRVRGSDDLNPTVIRKSRLFKYIQNAYANYSNRERACILTLLRLAQENIRQYPDEKKYGYFERILNSANLEDIKREFGKYWVIAGGGLGIEPNIFIDSIYARVDKSMTKFNDYHNENNLNPLFGIGDFAFYSAKYGLIDALPPPIENYIDPGRGRFIEGRRIRNKITMEATFCKVEKMTFLYDGFSWIVEEKDRNDPEMDKIQSATGVASFFGDNIPPASASEKFSKQQAWLKVMRHSEVIIQLKGEELPEARIQQFVFPCPCDTVSPEIFNRTSWNCWAAGADFYIPREIIRKDSVNYTIEGLVTDFNDTLSFYSYVVRGEANIDTNSIYFQDRLFMGIIENMNVLGPGDEREYSLGFRIKDNNSGRTKDTLSVATINYLPEYSGYIAEKRFSKNAYPPLTAPGNELQRENTIIIWFPATGLNKITNDSGTAEIYSGTADIYALDRRLARKEGYWKISDIRFGNIGDTLSAPPVDTTQLKPADKYAPGFLGTYDIRINKGPNAIIKMPIDVSRLSEGIYDMQLNIYADSGGLKKQICQARIEAVFIK